MTWKVTNYTLDDPSLARSMAIHFLDGLRRDQQLLTTTSHQVWIREKIQFYEALLRAFEEKMQAA